MSRSDEQRLADILDAAAELSAIVGRGRDAFLADAILKRAAERLLEIIGEAASRLAPETQALFPSLPFHRVEHLTARQDCPTSGGVP